eukprot:12190761-Karenia_brevis.AAC.1
MSVGAQTQHGGAKSTGKAVENGGSSSGQPPATEADIRLTGFSKTSESEWCKTCGSAGEVKTGVPASPGPPS